MLSLVSSPESFAAPTAATPPTFAKDFYVGLQTNLGINQGGYNTKDGGVCCSVTTTPQCKIQYINQGSDHREQGTMNRTREDSAQGTIVNWYDINGSKKSLQMALEPGSAANSTHDYVCAQACPLTGEFSQSVQIGDGNSGILDTPRDLGAHPYTQKGPAGTTKTCEKWQWTETLLKVIRMEKTDFYVDMSVTPPAPFGSLSIIEPFGKQIGQEETGYLEYAPGDQSSYFDIDPATVMNCPAPQNGCNQQQNDAAKDDISHYVSSHKFHAKTALELAKKAAAVAPASALRADPPPPPDIDFGGDFSSDEESIMLINQGGHPVASGDVCCTPSQPGQCQVQLSHAKGTRYFDLTNQRERFEDVIEGQTTIDFYKLGKSMLINVTDGKETCQEYCPIQADDKMEKFDPFDPDDTTKDLGPDADGNEHFQWTDVIFKVVKMSTTDFYADIKSTPAVPISLSQALTPFGGPKIGGSNQTWANWKTGPQPAAKFDIAGLDVCPMSKNCQQPSMQNHRLRTRQFHTFYANEEIVANQAYSHLAHGINLGK